MNEPTEISLPAALLAIALVIGAIAAFTLSDLTRHDHGHSQSRALSNLKTLFVAQTLFREGDLEQDGELDYGSLRELSDAGLIDAQLGSGTMDGYLFASAASSQSPGTRWLATASPRAPESDGGRYFAINQAGLPYVRADAPFPLLDHCGISTQGLPAGGEPLGSCAVCGQPITAPGWKELDAPAPGFSNGDPSAAVCATCPLPAAAAEDGAAESAAAEETGSASD